jgi:O-antigen ligase
MNSFGFAGSTALSPSPAASQTEHAPWTGKLALQALIVAYFFITVAEFRVREQSTEIDAQILLRLLVSFAAGLFGLISLPRTLPLFNRFPGALCIIYAVWAVLVVPASIDPLHSFIDVGFTWCAILFVPAVLTRLSAKEVVFTVIAAQFVFLLSCWITYLIAPEFGDHSFLTADGTMYYYRFGGLTHPNGLAQETAMFIILLVTAGLERWAPRPAIVALCAFGVVTLLFTESRTSIIAVALTSLVLLGRHGVFRLPKAPVAWFLAAFLVFLVGTMEWNPETFLRSLTRSGEVEEIAHANGRLDLWRFAAGKIAAAPVAGYGYGCGALVVHEKFGSIAPHVHNQFLNAMLDMGIPGGLLLLSMFAVLLGAMFFRRDAFPDGVVLVALISGFTEITVFNVTPSGSTFLWITALFWGQCRRSAARSGTPAGLSQEATT